MDRIGIAASKIARGNIIIYNAAVFIIIFMLALLIVVIAGSAIMAALLIVGYVINGLLPHSFLREWNLVMISCLSSLTAVVGFFAVIALIRNFKVKFTTSDEDCK